MDSRFQVSREYLIQRWLLLWMLMFLSMLSLSIPHSPLSFTHPISFSFSSFLTLSLMAAKTKDGVRILNPWRQKVLERVKRTWETDFSRAAFNGVHSSRPLIVRLALIHWFLRLLYIESSEQLL